LKEPEMKKYLTIAAGIMAGAVLMTASLPAMAGGVDVDVNIGVPGVYRAPVYIQPEPVYVQTRPAYIREEREQDWRERQLRARQWQAERGHDRHERDDRQDERRGHDRGGQHGHDD
jgi:hypothetical protein